MFNKADRDGDGQLDFLEFYDLVQLQARLRRRAALLKMGPGTPKSGFVDGDMVDSVHLTPEKLQCRHRAAFAFLMSAGKCSCLAALGQGP